MKRMILTLVVAMMSASAPAAGDSSEADPKQDPNQLVCKKQPRLGTRFVDKICHTRAEWNQITEESRRAAAEMANRALPRGCTRPNEC